MSSAGDTGKARRTRRASGSHFRQSKAWRTFPLSKLEKISEEDAEALFRKMRWPATDGAPVCPWCGSHEYWYLENQRRWKCKAAKCRKHRRLVDVRADCLDLCRCPGLTATGEALRRYLVATMGVRRAERSRALFLDSGNRLICDELVAEGTPSGVWIEPQTILRRALELHAVGLIVVHNHPGGQSFPSTQDARFTPALAAAAQALGIRLQDHLIVAGDVCVSLRAEGFIQ